MVNLREFYSGRRVWLSGHTGFKGSWMTRWLLELGASVHGYAQPPETTPSLFGQLSLAASIEHEVADIRDGRAVASSIREFRPEVVIHMAAQPLVRRSYQIPVETFETNAMGSVHVLEALRTLSGACAAVIVTTDKCYENLETGKSYREDDPLGGHDPYSSSKAMAEIATAAYRSSYFRNHPVRVASARAGNVIGGGDWAEDRIVPDAMRALAAGADIPVRNPLAVRPWQHVLEPLGGYLMLAYRLACDPSVATSFNFGPGPGSNRTVKDLVAEILKHRPGGWVDAADPSAPHEAQLLDLAIEKSRDLLDWEPCWDFEETVKRTSEWYRDVDSGVAKPESVTVGQIRDYNKLLFSNRT